MTGSLGVDPRANPFGKLNAGAICVNAAPSKCSTAVVPNCPLSTVSTLSVLLTTFTISLPMLIKSSAVNPVPSTTLILVSSAPRPTWSTRISTLPVVRSDFEK